MSSKEVTKTMNSDRIELRKNTCAWLNYWEFIIDTKFLGLRLHCCCMVILSYGLDLCHFLDKFLHLGIRLVIFNFQFRIQNKIPFVLKCFLRFVGFDFVNFIILMFLAIFHISSLIFCLTGVLWSTSLYDFFSHLYA